MDEKIELTGEEKAKEAEKALIIELLNALLSNGEDFEVYSGEDAKKWNEETEPGQMPLLSLGVTGKDGKKRPVIEIGILGDKKPRS